MPTDECASDDAATTSARTWSQAWKLTGISYHQIDYWARTGLLRPSLADPKGSGQRRRYSYRDLVQLKVIRRLLDAGIGLARIRRVVAFLGTQLGEDLASASLVVNGSESLLTHQEGELVDALRHGQGVFSVVALGALSAELDGAITNLRAPVAGDGAAVDRAMA